MPRTPDENVAIRNQKIIQSYTNNRFQDRGDLARTHGVTPQVISRVLTAAGLTSRDERKGKLKQVDRTCVSPLHKLIGLEVRLAIDRIMLDRNRQQGRLSDTRQFGDIHSEMGMSSTRLSGTLQGLEDCTLFELQRIAEWMKLTSVSELILQAEARGKPKGV